MSKLDSGAEGVAHGEAEKGSALVINFVHRCTPVATMQAAVSAGMPLPCYSCQFSHLRDCALKFVG